MARYAKREGCGSVNTLDTYIEICSSVSYLRIIGLPTGARISTASTQLVYFSGCHVIQITTWSSISSALIRLYVVIISRPAHFVLSHVMISSNGYTSIFWSFTDPWQNGSNRSSAQYSTSQFLPCVFVLSRGVKDLAADSH
jgi:hypothetical protein